MTGRHTAASDAPVGVVVTGVGATSCFGDGAARLFDALCAGDCGIHDWPEWGGKGPVARIPGGGAATTTELVRRAAVEALTQAGLLTADGCADAGLAIVGASTCGDMQKGEAAWTELLTDPPVRHPLDFLWGQLSHAPAQALRRQLGTTGPCWTVSSACTSGAVAVAQAADLVAAGRAHRVLAFGGDALCRTTTHGFGALSAHATEPCRPFDKDRAGMSLGEGAGVLVLERADLAAARGARVLARLLGSGNASDAWRLTAPHPEGRGARAAIAAALGALPAAAVGYVCAHATGTPLNDAMEGRVLHDELPAAAVSGVKGSIGHTMGAAGAIEAVVAVLALMRQRLPPNVGLRDPEQVDLDLVRQTRDARGLTHAMSVNFAFGGSNTALLFARGDA